MEKFSRLLEHRVSADKDLLNHFLNYDLLSQKCPSLAVPTRTISGKNLDFLNLSGEWQKKKSE